jgi:hypothetical protein
VRHWRQAAARALATMRAPRRGPGRADGDEPGWPIECAAAAGAVSAQDLAAYVSLAREQSDACASDAGSAEPRGARCV